MRGKQCIAIMLILIFSIPLLPIAPVGDLLSSNQLQEEIIHPTVAKEVEYAEHTLLYPLLDFAEPDAQALRICLIEQLTSRHADDINTPPPNM